jgi:hypothetical protein
VTKRLKLPSGKVIRFEEYVPPRERRAPMPHYDRLALRCELEGWSLELVRMRGGLSLQVWAVDPARLLACVRVSGSADLAARAVLRAL